MLQLEFRQDLTELYPRPDVIVGIGSYFIYTQPEDRKFVHDIDLVCYWKNKVKTYSTNSEVYMERENGRFKVLRRPAIGSKLPLDICCFDEVCLNRAIMDSHDSSPEARKAFYSGVLLGKYLKGKEIILKKIINKLGRNFEDIIEERYRILQLTDFDTFKKTEPYKAWKVLKRLSDLSEKRNINGSSIIRVELNKLRDRLNKSGDDQSLTDKLQELERRLLELAVKHYDIDGTDFV